MKPGDKLVVPVSVERGNITRVEHDIRPLMGAVVTIPVTIGQLRLAVYVSTSAFDTSSVLAQDATVKMLAKRIADALEGKP